MSDIKITEIIYFFIDSHTSCHTSASFFLNQAIYFLVHISDKRKNLYYHSPALIPLPIYRTSPGIGFPSTSRYFLFFNLAILSGTDIRYISQKVINVIFACFSVDRATWGSTSSLSQDLEGKLFQIGVKAPQNIPILPMAFLTFAEAKVGSAPPVKVG